MKSLKNLTGDSLEQLIDYQVVDQNGDEIGSLHSLWSEPDTGAVEFLGVKTGWLFGHNHVVPAEKAELDESENVVRLPYTALFIKEAPSISADAEISEAEEASIYQYYGLDRTGPSIETATTPATTGWPAATDAETLAGAAAVPPVSPAITGENDEASAARWRRTKRALINDAVSGGEIDKSNAVGTALDDLVGGDTSGAMAPLTAASAGSFGTSNLYGSTGDTTPVAEDSLGAASEASVGTGGEGLAAGPTTSGTATGTHPDPITGEPGAHPVGTGVGALGAGAAGMAVGAIAGPVGAIIGGIAGAVGGGYAGKGVAESIDPTEEDAHWQSNYRNAAYFENDYEYADYAPAYRVGYEGFNRYNAPGRGYEDAEGDLQRDYSQARGGSRLDWDKAKSATRDAWERLGAKAAAAPR